MIRWVVSARVTHLLVDIFLSGHLLASHHLKLTFSHENIIDHPFYHTCLSLVLVGGKRWLLAKCLHRTADEMLEHCLDGCPIRLIIEVTADYHLIRSKFLLSY